MNCRCWRCRLRLLIWRVEQYEKPDVGLFAIVSWRLTGRVRRLWFQPDFADADIYRIHDYDELELVLNTTSAYDAMNVIRKNDA